MELYTLKNQKTGEEKYFMKKTHLAKYLDSNSDRVELAVLKNKPIRKKTGDCYEIERRNVELGIEIEDV